MAVKAYVLIVADPGQTGSVYQALKRNALITDCYEVMGPYDIVVELEVDDLTEIALILSEQIRTVPGIESTTSLVTIPR